MFQCQLQSWLLARASSQGLLIRSGRALEQLVDVDVVIFDKTGTLTEGHPSVVHFAIFDTEGRPIQTVSDARRKELLQLSTSLEQGLNHPIAKAIRDSAEREEIDVIPCDAWDYRVGRGVVASVNGQQALLGNSNFFLRKELKSLQLRSAPILL